MWLRNEDAALEQPFRDVQYTCAMDIVSRLRAKISSGEYLPDGKLGTYTSLKQELSVPEKPLASALSLLQESGDVQILRGRGGIYIAKRPSIRYCSLGEHYVALEGFGTTKVSDKNPEGRQAYCIPCARLNSQLRYHHMSREQYDRMLHEQGGNCAICDEFMDVSQIDHDHTCCPNGPSCGRCTRSLLCKDCNFTLGWSRDNPARLIAAATYVLQHKEVVQHALAS